MDLMNPVSRWLELLSSRERRKAQRQESPHVVAHYWDGAAPLPHRIRDISSTGLYLLTEQRWYPGTVIRLVLQRSSAAETDPDRSITVNATVVRSGSDGVGLSLLLPRNQVTRAKRTLDTTQADATTFRRFLQRLLGIESEGKYPVEQHPNETNLLIPRGTESEQQVGISSSTLHGGKS
jgi:hypothetical protein